MSITWVVLTLVMHIGRETTRNELGENISEEGRLVYAPEQEMVEITPEQQMKQDSNGTTERKHVSMKILTCKEQDYMVEIDKG